MSSRRVADVPVVRGCALVRRVVRDGAEVVDQLVRRDPRGPAALAEVGVAGRLEEHDGEACRGAAVERAGEAGAADPRVDDGAVVVDERLHRVRRRDRVADVEREQFELDARGVEVVRAGQGGGRSRDRARRRSSCSPGTGRGRSEVCASGPVRATTRRSQRRPWRSVRRPGRSCRRRRQGSRRRRGSGVPRRPAGSAPGSRPPRPSRTTSPAARRRLPAGRNRARPPRPAERARAE